MPSEATEGKTCNRCETHKSLDEFYSQTKIKVNGEKYLYYHPECKDCGKISAKKWALENKEAVDESKKKHRNSEKGRAVVREWSAKRRASGEYRKWQRNNTEKLKQYARTRSFHKDHDISKEELELLYVYADSSCMYCGLTEEESTIKYNQTLHKDHAINMGSDGIENCILACKGCNSRKHNKDWEVWFKDSDIYNEDRYNVITSWLAIWESNEQPIIQ